MDGVPAPVAPMLAVEGPLPVGGGWAYETKWDFCTWFRPADNGQRKAVGRRDGWLTTWLIGWTHPGRGVLPPSRGCCTFGPRVRSE